MFLEYYSKNCVSKKEGCLSVVGVHILVLVPLSRQELNVSFKM